jgi:UDP-N-acetylglucosamine 2-epimerase (non-hydrolysing)
MHITCIVGARPNFIKLAALVEEFRRRPGFAVRLVHTGQHFSPEMSDAFFADLELPQPDVNLGIGGGSQTAQAAAMMIALEAEFLAHRPDVLVVVGDVTSTLAAALVAVRSGIPIAHVEAGLRSFDRAMPEEINRVLTDAISDLLFITESGARRNLLAEGINGEKIHFVGNVMIDTLLRFRRKAALSDVLDRLGLTPRGYVVATLHRPSNVDSPERLRELIGVFAELAETVPFVFPIHPRTRARIEDARIPTGRLLLTPPLGYLDFLRLLSDARLVMTDSGGIQEETTILRVPCLTLRENTERPVTITHGTNRLAGTRADAVLAAARSALSGGEETPDSAPELWDGNAGRRIADVLESFAAARATAPAEEMA